MDAASVDGGQHDGAAPGDGGDARPSDASADAGPSDAGPFRAHPRLAGLGANEAMDLGPYECATTPGDLSCQRVTEFSGFTYDGVRHQLLMFGGGHATTFTDAVYRFDLTTLRWEALYPPTPCEFLTLDNLDSVRGAWLDGPVGPYPRPISRHTYDELVVVGDDLIMLAAANGKGGCAAPVGEPTDPYHFPARVAHFNIMEGTWSFSETAQGDHRAGFDYPGADYDPISGLVVSLGAQHVEVYDPETRTERVIVQGDYGDEHAFPLRGKMGIEASLVYYPPTDRFYYFGRGGDLGRVRVWELKLDRDDLAQSRVTLLETTGTAPEQRRGYAYDTRNRVIGGGVRNGNFYAFHPEEARWEEVVVGGETPDNSSYHALAYDPVNNVFLFLGKVDSLHIEMWAYRYR